jgi:hypothetical protein
MYLYPPTNNATAQIVALPVEVASGSPGNITSALRLQTGIGGGSNLAQVFAICSTLTRSPIVGLFNGMLFKDMVAKGIRFEYSFFKANVTNGNSNAAPAIKFTVYSPSTTNWTTFVWDPYQGQVNSLNIPPTNVWVSNIVLNTTGTASAPVGGGRGWRNTRWLPKSSQATLAAWVTHLNTNMPNAMADAIVEQVQIGVGTGNDGVTSYVDSLRVSVGDYDWKWTFGG